MLDEHVLSVKQLSDILKSCFDNPLFKSLSIYGEIYSVNFSNRFLYLDLGDQGFKQSNSPIIKVAFSLFYGSPYDFRSLKQGDVIKVHGSLSYYQHGSSITFWGDSFELIQSQQGKALLLKQQTLKKLDSLGYLDKKEKKTLPKYCKKVAIITAKEGAAYQDILKTLHDRFPVDSVLFPCQVQGEKAASSIVKAINEAKKYQFDCLIIGRGGGSKTDLSCFDDEKVCLAIAECPFPTITCIGHTIDIAIADRVSDYRAITPTEAASLINPSLDDCEENILALKETLNNLFKENIYAAEQQLFYFKSRLESLSPKKKVEINQRKLDSLKRNLNDAFALEIKKARSDISDFKGKLSMSYQNFLSIKKNKLNDLISSLKQKDPSVYSGLAKVFSKGKHITSIKDINKDDSLSITFNDGKAEVVVKEVAHG